MRLVAALAMVAEGLAVHGAPQSAEGFRTDTGIWWFSTGHEVPRNAVYAWTELPACPGP